MRSRLYTWCISRFPTFPSSDLLYLHKHSPILQAQFYSLSYLSVCGIMLLTLCNGCAGVTYAVTALGVGAGYMAGGQLLSIWVDIGQ